MAPRTWANPRTPSSSRARSLSSSPPSALPTFVKSPSNPYPDTPFYPADRATYVFVLIHEQLPEHPKRKERCKYVYRRLQDAKAHLERIKAGVPDTVPQWTPTVQISHQKIVGGDPVEGFTVKDGSGVAREMYWIEKVVLGV